MLFVDDIFVGTRKASALNTMSGKPRSFRNPFFVLATLFALVFLPVAALAEHLSWHKFSRSYEVHLGVVTAGTADRDNELRWMHVSSPHGKTRRTDATRHVMVTVFRRDDKSRVVNAEVTAEVVENDLIHVKRDEKALDASRLSSGTHYCNFFDLHWNGRYRINVRIREPGNNVEHVTFYQEETAL
jgi:hypothetical protein